MLFLSFLFEHTLTAVCTLPEYPSCRESNVYEVFKQSQHLHILYIFDQTDLYRLEVRLELNTVNARLIVSPPSLSPSHPPTPPPSRWPALTNLPQVTQVSARLAQLVRSYAVFLLARWSETSFLLSRLCLKCLRYEGRFAMNINIKSSTIFTDTVDALTAMFAV